MSSCRAGNTPAACKVGDRVFSPARGLQHRAARVMGAAPPRERGRPARMHCRYVPLSFPAMGHPAPCRQERHGPGRGRAPPPPGSAWAWLRHRKPARSPSSHKSDGSRSTRERGRPARMLSRCVLLSFPAMAHPATLPAETACARPKQALTPLPVDPSGGDGRGFASMVRAGRPRSRVGPHSMTPSQPLPEFLTGQPASPSRCCSTSPTAPARTGSRSRARPSAAPPVRRSRAK